MSKNCTSTNKIKFYPAPSFIHTIFTNRWVQPGQNTFCVTNPFRVPRWNLPIVEFRLDLLTEIPPKVFCIEANRDTDTAKHRGTPTGDSFAVSRHGGDNILFFSVGDILLICGTRQKSWIWKRGWLWWFRRERVSNILSCFLTASLSVYIEWWVIEDKTQFQECVVTPRSNKWLIVFQSTGFLTFLRGA